MDIGFNAIGEGRLAKTTGSSSPGEQLADLDLNGRDDETRAILCVEQPYEWDSQAYVSDDVHSAVESRSVRIGRRIRGRPLFLAGGGCR